MPPDGKRQWERERMTEEVVGGKIQLQSQRLQRMEPAQMKVKCFRTLDCSVQSNGWVHKIVANGLDLQPSCQSTLGSLQCWYGKGGTKSLKMFHMHAELIHIMQKTLDQTAFCSSNAGSQKSVWWCRLDNSKCNPCQKRVSAKPYPQTHNQQPNGMVSLQCR